MADVFISYKSQRRAAAEHLAEALRDHGYTVWFDYDLLTGQDFGRQIESQLKDAKAVLVLWDGQSVDSEWVRNEARYAKRNRKYAPVKIESCDLPIEFDGDQTIDLAGWTGEPQAHEPAAVLKVVATLVGRTPKPNLAAVDLANKSWRRYGGRTLAQFALIDRQTVRDRVAAPTFVDKVGPSWRWPLAGAAAVVALGVAAWAVVANPLGLGVSVERASDDLPAATEQPLAADVENPVVQACSLDGMIGRWNCEAGKKSCTHGAEDFSELYKDEDGQHRWRDGNKTELLIELNNKVASIFSPQRPSSRYVGILDRNCTRISWKDGDLYASKDVN